MLLIGLTGPPASGKTTLLLRIAEWCRAEQIAVGGFVSIALPEEPRTSGAAKYALRAIDGSFDVIYAERDESLSPPYRISTEATAEAESLADALADSPRRVVTFDELGKFEAAGEGLADAFASLIDNRPPVVIATIREERVGQIEQRFGCRFTVVDVKDPSVFQTITTMVRDHSDWQRIGAYGAGSAAIEMTIGSALHAARIPLRGLFLSTTQSLVMMHASEGLEQRRRVVWVPFIAAGMKALSPAGSRLRPMLAISVQGLLFARSLSLFGWNLVGAAVGGGLVGAWSAAQGVLLQYLFMGGDMVRAYDAAVHWMAQKLEVNDPGFIALAAGWILICAAVGAGATVIGWTRRHRHAAAVRDALSRRASKTLPSRERAGSFRNHARETLRDLARPAFWLPVAIVIALVLVSGSTAESAALIAMRAFAVAFVLYAVARTVDPRKVSGWLRRKGYWGPALAFDEALGAKPEGDRGSSAAAPPQDRV